MPGAFASKGSGRIEKRIYLKDLTLMAKTRTGNAKQVRDAGFIPAVLNDHAATSTAIQFESAPLNKVIAQHGSNAKIWVKLDDVKTYGYIKEVQRNPVDGKVIHVAVQLVAKDQDIHMQLPIVFQGRDELENRLLHLQIYKQEIAVSGTTELMPDVALVDVTEREVGDSITGADFKLSKGIKLVDPETEIYAVIKAARKILAE